MIKNLNSTLLFFIFILIYALGSFSKIPFGDGVGFVLDTEKEEYISTVSPVSHFLYINSAIFLKKTIGLSAIDSNLFLIIASAALVVAMVYRAVYLLTKKQWVAVSTSFIFGFSFSFWKNAEIVEVYTYNLVWVSLFIYYVMKVFLQDYRKKSHLLLASFFLSMSMWTHIENIFFVPSFLLMLFYFKENRRAVYLSISFLILSFLFMFALNQIQGLPLKTVFVSNQGNWVDDSLHKSVREYLKDFGKSILYLFYNFTFFTALGILGAVKLFQLERKLFYVLAIASTLIYGFSTIYAVSDNYVFFLPFNLIYAIGIGYGLQHCKKIHLVRKLSPAVLLVPILYSSIFHVAKKFPAAANFEKSKEYKGGLAYYLLPWMNDNVGILEFTIENRIAPEPIHWMTYSAKQYIELLQKKGFTIDEIKKR